MTKINKDHFRVAIFGSARIKKGDPRYKQVHLLAKMIAKESMDIVTGGGPGLMDSASKGHHAGRKGKKIHSIGLTIKLPKEQVTGYHLDIRKDFNRFSGRLDKFMELSNAVVVAPGGIGTLLEFFYTWQLIQVKHICEIPVILLGENWQGLLVWIKKEMLRKKLMSKEDFKNIFVIKDNKEAIRLLKKIYEDSLTQEHVCKNFKKYRRLKLS
ncbi:LOG family protein [Candidatus Woesearchaeota archaeon]|jgi:uncharacterized protein (TIGR00730 family)|nr:LOG family protein [Candidatus Woesearchaeota archaeon]